MLYSAEEMFGSVNPDWSKPSSRGDLLLLDRLVVAPAEVDHARVVAQLLADGQRGQVHDVELLRGDAPAAARGLPLVAALEARVDQDAGPVHLVVEVLRHLLALGPDPVQAHALDHRDLVGQVGRRVVQEQVLRPAAAPEVERHAVDLEDPDPVGRLGRRRGQVGGHRADAEQHRAGHVGDLAVRRHPRAQPVQRLAAHLVGPPQLRVAQGELRIGAGGEGDRAGRARGQGDGLADLDGVRRRRAE